MMKHSKKTGCAPNRTHPAIANKLLRIALLVKLAIKATDYSDMYNREFPVGRKGSTSILPALHLLRHAIRSCCQRIKYANCYHTRRKRKIRTLLQSETGSDFSCLVGAGGFEPPKLKSSRFTVCPHWPLGNTPIYSSSQSRTACIYYHLGAYLSTAFYSFFRKEADRTAQSRGRP